MAYFYALLSAIFAALTSILAKIGISEINSNLATAIRTTVVLVFSWIMVFVVGGQHDIGAISKRNLIFLILSGLATGISWLAFYKALQMTDASKVDVYKRQIQIHKKKSDEQNRFTYSASPFFSLQIF